MLVTKKMWAAIKRKIGLFIGYPDLNSSEDEYFGRKIREFCRTRKEKIVYIDMFVQHHHRSNLRGFIKQRLKYGQSMILERILLNDYRLPILLMSLLFSFLFFIIFLRGFLWGYFLGLIVGYFLIRTRLWRWIYKNWGGKVLFGSILLSYLGVFVSLLSMCYGLLKSRKKVKIYREENIDYGEN